MSLGAGLLLLAMATASQRLSAQDSAAQATQPAPRYAVELVVFRYRQPAAESEDLLRTPPLDRVTPAGTLPGAGSDAVPTGTGLPQDYEEPAAADGSAVAGSSQVTEAQPAGPSTLAIVGDRGHTEPASIAPSAAMPAAQAANDSDAANPSASGDAAIAPPQPMIMPLPADAATLDKIYDRLARLQRYQPILHLGWIQPVEDGADLHYEVTPDVTRLTGLTGTVSLSKGRFLHLRMDLWLQPVAGVSSAGWSAQWGQDNAGAGKLYHLQESRRIMGDDPQYFDSPAFGVIAAIWQMPEPAGSGSAAGKTPPPP